MTDSMSEVVERLAFAIWQSRENTFPDRVRRMLPDNIDRASGAWATVMAQAHAALTELSAMGLVVVKKSDLEKKDG